MSHEKYTRSSEFYKLISRLYDEKNERCSLDTIGYLSSIDEIDKVTIKNIGCLLECAYRFLTALKVENLKDFCKYLNLWLDEQKSTYVNGNSGITEKQKKLIENLWNQIQAHFPISKCTRHQDGSNIFDKKKHMKLLKYCIYRDYIKKKCEYAIKHPNSIQYFCPVLSEYTNEYYEQFKSENRCLEYPDEDNHYKYYVSPECSLYDMPKTFPKFDSHKKEILYAKNSREAINKCTNTTESDSSVDEKNSDRVEVNASEDEGKVVSTRLDDHEVKLDDDPAEPSKLVPPSPRDDIDVEDTMIITDHRNPIEGNMPPKVGTIGATVAGSSLFLLMMYKDTPMGSWINTRVLGRNKLMENMRNNNYELLLNGVEDRDVSLNDTMYHISYNSSSNQ